MSDAPRWSNPLEAAAVIAYPTHIRRTLLTAAIVGSVLFAINQLDVVLAGQATPRVWLKVGVTYIVPFVVSNVGLLIGTRQHKNDT